MKLCGKFNKHDRNPSTKFMKLRILVNFLCAITALMQNKLIYHANRGNSSKAGSRCE